MQYKIYKLVSNSSKDKQQWIELSTGWNDAPVWVAFSQSTVTFHTLLLQRLYCVMLYFIDAQRQRTQIRCAPACECDVHMQNKWEIVFKSRKAIHISCAYTDIVLTRYNERAKQCCWCMRSKLEQFTLALLLKMKQFYYTFAHLMRSRLSLFQMDPLCVVK